MTKLRYLLALPVFLAGFGPAAGSHEGLGLHSPGLGQDVAQQSVFGQSPALGHNAGGMTTSQYDANNSQRGRADVIPPSVALRVALSYSPGSQGLGVNLLEGRRLVYAVKLKTGNRVHRVLVDARTGQIVGE